MDGTRPELIFYETERNERAPVERVLNEESNRYDVVHKYVRVKKQALKNGNFSYRCANRDWCNVIIHINEETGTVTKRSGTHVNDWSHKFQDSCQYELIDLQKQLFTNELQVEIESERQRGLLKSFNFTGVLLHVYRNFQTTQGQGSI